MSARARLAAGALALALPFAGARGAMPAFPEVPPPELYGRVLLDAGAGGKGTLPPAVFDHWRHRSIFTCRLCHVDVGFAMQANASGVTRASNAAGMHCGACHDGRRTHLGQVVFAACTPAGPPRPTESCARCHGAAADPRNRKDYVALAEKLPTYGGGYIDWERAEARGNVSPIDLLDGLSIVRPPMKVDRDVPIEAKGTWLGTVTFSHRKHTAWNGCEVCHPEIFPVTQRGATKFTMADVSAGRYCGACHRAVAFPLSLCQRCHKGGAPGAD